MCGAQEVFGRVRDSCSLTPFYICCRFLRMNSSSKWLSSAWGFRGLLPPLGSVG
jgi:hypothetical protein